MFMTHPSEQGTEIVGYAPPPPAPHPEPLKWPKQTTELMKPKICMKQGKHTKINLKIDKSYAYKIKKGGKRQ